MAVYYRTGGGVADFALLFTVVFLLAVLAAFQGTLTMPGIAGVILFSSALSRPLVIALSLILAGGGSNLFDRLSNDGRVVDFVILGAAGLRTGIFNLADVAIMLGASLFLLTMVRQKNARTP